MKLDGKKLYMKIVALDEIYNIVVENFLIWCYLNSQIILTVLAMVDDSLS